MLHPSRIKMYINFSHKFTEKLQAYFYYVYVSSCKIFLRLLKGNMSEHSSKIRKKLLSSHCKKMNNLHIVLKMFLPCIKYKINKQIADIYRTAIFVSSISNFLKCITKRAQIEQWPNLVIVRAEFVSKFPNASPFDETMLFIYFDEKRCSQISMWFHNL